MVYVGKKADQTKLFSLYVTKNQEFKLEEQMFFGKFGNNPKEINEAMLF